VEVGAKRVMHLEDEDGVGIQVKRDDVCNAAPRVMSEGLEAKTRREKAKYFKKWQK
jgi:hypothetical protein